jgi:hypothetical protein
MRECIFVYAYMLNFSIVTLEDVVGAMQRGVISQEYLSDMMQYKDTYGGR